MTHDADRTAVPSGDDNWEERAQPDDDHGDHGHENGDHGDHGHDEGPDDGEDLAGSEPKHEHDESDRARDRDVDGSADDGDGHGDRDADHDASITAPGLPDDDFYDGTGESAEDVSDPDDPESGESGESGDPESHESDESHESHESESDGVDPDAVENDDVDATPVTGTALSAGVAEPQAPIQPEPESDGEDAPDAEVVAAFPAPDGDAAPVGAGLDAPPESLPPPASATPVLTEPPQGLAAGASIASVDAAAGDTSDVAVEIPLTTAEVADQRAWRADAARSDGRRRRRQGAMVVLIALASAAAGVLIGTRIKSPADEAADRRPPPPSRITVPVEQQVLKSTLVLSAEVRYNEPTPVRLAGPVGVADGESQVVTKAPTLEQVAQEGNALFEVTGRPVFFLQGELPMYRRIAKGTEGEDVLQLETSLQRLGYDIAEPDNVFDEATETAVSQMYDDAGYKPEGPTRAQRDELRVARQAVVDAEDTLRTAKKDLENQSNSVQESQLLQAQQAVAAAEAAVPAADAAAERDNDAAAQAVVTATVTRDSAKTIRDSAVRIRNSIGSVDPDTGLPPTEARLAELDADIARSNEDLQGSEAALTTAIADEKAVASQGVADVKAARDALELARVQLAELTAPVDTTEAQTAITQAEKNLETAKADLAELDTDFGIRVSPGEIVFVPILPTTVTELLVETGDPATEQLATMSTAETLVSARVSRGDSPLVSVGATVGIDLRDVSLETTGTVVSVGQPREDGEESSSASSASGRLEVLIAPDEPEALREFVFYGARVTIDIASTDGEVLVVPVAALSLGADGTSRVQIETAPITEEDAGATMLVPVEVGLTANGLVEVSADELEIGDRVVVGLDSTGAAEDADADGTDG